MGPTTGVIAAARRFAKMAAVALALALTACSRAGLDSLPSAGKAVVVSAEEDGRIKLADGRRVRLAGVEVADRTALHDLVAGQAVELLAVGPNRNVVQLRVKRGRRWVQGELLQQGLARVRTAPNEAALARPMLSREAEARARSRGLWASRWRVLTADEAEHARGFQIVEGRVRSAKALRRGVFLDFGDDWREDLSVEVPDAALDRFAAAGRDPERLEGELVRVRGRLQPTRNGPLITLDHPEALELLDER
jgi:endonuclease YncB( thermonuclease family)